MRNCTGIDVAKQSSDLHSLKTGQDRWMESYADGIRDCVALCNEIRPKLIVTEATGGYERALADEKELLSHIRRLQKIA